MVHTRSRWYAPLEDLPRDARIQLLHRGVTASPLDLRSVSTASRNHENLMRRSRETVAEARAARATKGSPRPSTERSSLPLERRLFASSAEWAQTRPAVACMYAEALSASVMMAHGTRSAAEKARIALGMSPRAAHRESAAGQADQLTGGDGQRADGGQPLELETLWKLFHSFDADKSGAVDMEELPGLMSKLGVNVTKDKLRSLVAGADRDQDEKISFGEFVALVRRLLQRSVARAAKAGGATYAGTSEADGEARGEAVGGVVAAVGEPEGDEAEVDGTDYAQWMEVEEQIARLERSARRQVARRLRERTSHTYRLLAFERAKAEHERHIAEHEQRLRRAHRPGSAAAGGEGMIPLFGIRLDDDYPAARTAAAQRALDDDASAHRRLMQGGMGSLALDFARGACKEPSC